MGSPLVDKKTRELAVKLLQSGQTYRDTAKLLGIGEATVNRAWREFREHGEVKQPRRRGGRLPAISAEEVAEFRKLVDERPDATYDEIAAAWNKKTRQKISRSAIVRKVIGLGLTLKKKTAQACEKRSKKNASKRAMFRFRRKDIAPEKLVFLDEAGFHAKLDRTQARSQRGERAPFYRPSLPFKTYTMTGAVRLSGPVVMRGSAVPMNKRRFLCFLRQTLLPRLQPGDVLVMDNLAAHRNKMVRKVCRLWDIRVVYLPPYSPEYNPIEMVWGWMKSRLRSRLNRAAQCFRYAVAGAWRKAAKLSMPNLFRKCGYLQSCH